MMQYHVKFTREKGSVFATLSHEDDVIVKLDSDKFSETNDFYESIVESGTNEASRVFMQNTEDADEGVLNTLDVASAFFYLLSNDSYSLEPFSLSLDRTIYTIEVTNDVVLADSAERIEREQNMAAKEEMLLVVFAKANRQPEDVSKDTYSLKEEAIAYIAYEIDSDDKWEANEYESFSYRVIGVRHAIKHIFNADKLATLMTQRFKQLNVLLDALTQAAENWSELLVMYVETVDFTGDQTDTDLEHHNG